VRRALDADIPVLAICRGLQVLNVALGGTLIQDLPSEPARLLRHDAEGPPTTLAHTVAVTTGSCLAALVGPDETRAVNSRHHQAVRALGAGLVVTATSPDGVHRRRGVPAARFCVGVQWHPENFHATGEFDRLFDGFVDGLSLTPLAALEDRDALDVGGRGKQVHRGDPSPRRYPPSTSVRASRARVATSHET
jgi:putative glutamine amidotransferase